MYQRLFPDMPSGFTGKPFKLPPPKRGERQTRTGRWRGGSNVQLVGMEELQDTLTKMLESTDDLRDVWKDIYHPAVLEGERKFFDTEGDGKWPDLTDRYMFYKAKHGGGTGLLIGTPRRKRFPRTRGSLRDSLTVQGHPAAILDMSARWFRHGTRDPLANIFFSKKGRRKRKPMDAKSLSMQTAFADAVRLHAERYAQQWGGSV